MSDMLAVANEIENELKAQDLVGKRLGSGFCFMDNSRDVEFEYKDRNKTIKDIVEIDLVAILDVIKSIVSKYDDLTYSIRHGLTSFSFYIKPKPVNVEKDCEDERCDAEISVTPRFIRDNEFPTEKKLLVAFKKDSKIPELINPTHYLNLEQYLTSNGFEYWYYLIGSNGEEIEVS